MFSTGANAKVVNQSTINYPHVKTLLFSLPYLFYLPVQRSGLILRRVLCSHSNLKKRFLYHCTLKIDQEAGFRPLVRLRNWLTTYAKFLTTFGCTVCHLNNYSSRFNKMNLFWYMNFVKGVHTMNFI